MPTIIASNQTGSPVLLTRLGLTVPASSTLTLTDFATVNEIREDESLEIFIDGGSILLNFGNGDLTKGDSLKFFNIVTQEVTLPVRALSTVNIGSLSGTTTVDTISLAVNDRVLLTSQSTGSENGIWVIKAGAWVRPEDFADDQSSASALVAIQEGADSAEEVWICDNNSGSDIVGTDALIFSQISSTTGGSGHSLQAAYDGGNTITTASSADIAFTLTSGDFTVDSGSILVGGTTPLTVVSVDTIALSLDSTDNSNLTMTASDGADKTLTIAATNAGGGDGVIAVSADGEIDVDAGANLSLNSSGGAINVGNDGNTGAINIGTGAAARTITVGNQTAATAVTVDAGTGGVDVNSLGAVTLDGVGASNFTTDTGDLTLSTTTSGAINVNSVGAIDAQASGNVTIDSDTGSIGIGTDTDDGAIDIGTGTTAGRIITIGNNTGTTGVAIETGSGDLLIDAPRTTITGNLIVQGTTTTVESEIVNMADSFLYHNDGYEAISAVEGGFVVNYLPTATNTTVAATGFTAGVASTSNPTVSVASETGFVAGDYIQIAGANDQTNDGLFEVLSTAAGELTIAGVGNTGLTHSFAQNDFTTDTTVAGTIRIVTVGVYQVSTSGTPQFGEGSNSSLTFDNIVTTPGTGDLTLQNAYIGGNTITTSVGEGSVVIAGDQKLNITATNGLDVDTVADFDVTAFDVQMTGNNGFSIDGTADSNITATNTAATTAVTLTVEAANTGATSGDSTVDINASSTNGSGIIDMDADNTVNIDTLASGAINIGTDAVANTTTIGNTTTTTGVVVNSGTQQVEVDGVTYYGSNAGLPTATTSGFQEGDKVYDSTIEMEMRYDGTRGKWLSVEAMYIQFGRNGNVGTSNFYRGINGRVMSSTLGHLMPHAGTIVGLGYSRTDSDSATFDVVEGGTSRATLATAATSGKSNALDGDFSEDGILAIQNQAGGNPTSDVMGWVKVRWRST